MGVEGAKRGLRKAARYFDRYLDMGHKDLQVTRDVAWLEKADWPDFMTYEAEVNRVLPQHRMIGIRYYLRNPMFQL